MTLEIRNLTKRFGRLTVLDAVDLSIRPGRVTALLGPNGAGKTTLIKSVLGLTRPEGGEVVLGDTPIVGPTAHGHDYRARIGYMPQIARFPENLTGRDLIAMLCDLRGAPAPVAAPHKAPDDLVERFGLASQLDKPLRTLSGGTRQKINAVLAFLFDPELLILDEPTSGLDPIASGVLKDRIVQERAAGRTIIVTSHVMSEMEALSDDVVFLIDGRVRFAGAVTELLRATRQTTLERAVAHLMRVPLEVAA